MILKLYRGEKMKKNLFFVIGAVILVCAIFLIAYNSYLYFNSKKPKVEVNTLEIVLDDYGKINLNEQIPIDDSESNTVEPYKFIVKNKGNKSVNYELLIEDFVTDTKTGLLDRKYLNYELRLNNQVIKKDHLSNVKNNIIDTRSLSVNGENNYELRIWVNTDIKNTNWMGKTYNYNVSVNPRSE